MKAKIFCVFGLVALVATMALSPAAAETSTEQIEEWRAAAEQGDAKSQYILGGAYYFGEGVAQDLRKAVRWYRAAAEQGHAPAQYNLGVAYDYGEGIAKDQREAVRWYRAAAEQGHSKAQFNLGEAYYFGEDIAKNRREAVRWTRAAAEQGLAAAQFNLGLTYATGEGIAQDQREAVRWWRAAAEQGYAPAQFNLGNAYNNGEGVAQDQREAVRWYRMAAEQGNAKAQYNLGVSYDFGNGIAQDQRAAVRWYRLAAEQRHAKAQFNLGVSYWNGDGVITDEREAYIWYSLAKANGHQDATDSLRKLNWHDFLSTSEISSANKEAARRMEAIENRQTNDAESSAIGAHIGLAPTPKAANHAARVFENAWRSVVVVVTDDGQGSGVIIRPNIVATNCHVVDGSNSIVVYKSDNRRANTDAAFSATIRRADAARDFCLLDVDGLWGIAATVRRYDTLEVGEDVYGLGAPRGLDLSLSDGLVSQLREVDGQRVIQTNAAISPGSSGGGLFDSESNLIGILTSKISDKSTEGIGFAIPADLALAH